MISQQQHVVATVAGNGELGAPADAAAGPAAGHAHVPAADVRGPAAAARLERQSAHFPAEPSAPRRQSQSLLRRVAVPNE